MRKTPILVACLLVAAWAGKILSDSTGRAATNPTPLNPAVQTQNAQATSTTTRPPKALEPLAAHPMQ